MTASCTRLRRLITGPCGTSWKYMWRNCPRKLRRTCRVTGLMKAAVVWLRKTLTGIKTNSTTISSKLPRRSGVRMKISCQLSRAVPSTRNRSRHLRKKWIKNTWIWQTIKYRLVEILFRSSSRISLKINSCLETYLTRTEQNLIGPRNQVI